MAITATIFNTPVSKISISEAAQVYGLSLHELQRGAHVIHIENPAFLKAQKKLEKAKTFKSAYDCLATMILEPSGLRFEPTEKSKKFVIPKHYQLNFLDKKNSHSVLSYRIEEKTILAKWYDQLHGGKSALIVDAFSVKHNLAFEIVVHTSYSWYNGDMVRTLEICYAGIQKC